MLLCEDYLAVIIDSCSFIYSNYCFGLASPLDLSYLLILKFKFEKLLFYNLDNKLVLTTERSLLPLLSLLFFQFLDYFMDYENIFFIFNYKFFIIMLLLIPIELFEVLEGEDFNLRSSFVFVFDFLIY